MYSSAAMKQSLRSPRLSSVCNTKSASRRCGGVAPCTDRPLASADNTDASEAASKCPFLPQLRSPPVVRLHWLQQMQLQGIATLFRADKLVEIVLSQRGSDSMVQVHKQLAVTGFFMPATTQLTNEVLGEEATGTISSAVDQFYGLATLFGKDSVLTVKEPERHAKLRQLLQPAFSAAAIENYLPAIETIVTRHLGEWQAAGQEGIKAYPRIKMIALDLILQIIMGREMSQPALERLHSCFHDIIMGILAWPYLDLPFTPWHKALRAREEMKSYFQAGIIEARQQLAKGEEARGLLGRLVCAQDELGDRLTDSEICDNMLSLVGAGHDTISSTLTRCLSNLNDHPWVMEKLRAEQQAVQAKHGQHISAEALKDMPFADAVLRETLRRHSVAFAVGRMSTREFVVGGYQVPASQFFLLPFGALAAHDPRWKGKTDDMDPAKFNPDRLMTPEGQKPGQLMPFGAGTRYCPGAQLAMGEMKVFLAMLARSYRFTTSNTEWKSHFTTYYPANGLPLVLTCNHQ